MPAGKRTQQFWECCWIFPHSPSGMLAGGGKTTSPFATLEVNPHPPAPLNLYFCLALGGSCWLEAPTRSSSLKPGMPGSAESLREKLRCSLLPQPRRSSRRGTCLSPPGINHSSSLNPSNPNFHVSLFFSFCFSQFPPGGSFSRQHCGRGNWLDTEQDMGSRPPAAPPPQTPSTPLLSLPPPPEELCLLVGLGVSRVRRWLRRTPSTGGGSGTPTLSVRALCFPTATGNPVPELPYIPRPLPCPDVPQHPTGVTH